MAVIDGHIRCSRCRELKPVAEYAASAVKNGCGNCRACQRAYCRAYAAANPDKVREQRRANYHANLMVSREKVRKKNARLRADDPEGWRERERRWRASLSEEQRAERNENHRRYLRERPRLQRAHDLIRYGITPEEYDAMLAAQGGGCAICGARGNANGRRLAVDHDHVTGAARGILCHNCNAGIGHFADDRARMREALPISRGCSAQASACPS